MDDKDLKKIANNSTSNQLPPFLFNKITLFLNISFI